MRCLLGPEALGKHVSKKKQLGTASGAVVLSAIAAMAPVAGQALAMAVSNLAGVWRNARTRISRRNGTSSR